MFKDIENIPPTIPNCRSMLKEETTLLCYRAKHTVAASIRDLATKHHRNLPSPLDVIPPAKDVHNLPFI